MSHILKINFTPHYKRENISDVESVGEEYERIMNLMSEWLDVNCKNSFDLSIIDRSITFADKNDLLIFKIVWG